MHTRRSPPGLRSYEMQRRNYDLGGPFGGAAQTGEAPRPVQDRLNRQTCPVRAVDEDWAICIHEAAHVTIARQLFNRELVSVTVDPGVTKGGREYEGATRWQEPETGDLSIARLLKGKTARIIRQRSSELVDHFFRHAIDSMLIRSLATSLRA